MGYSRRRVRRGSCGAPLAPCFVEHVEAQGRALPAFVEREVEAYLKCGILEHGLLRVGCPACGFEHGLLRVGCPACGFEHLVAFCCKKRGFCPSCLGRRMTDTACHLRERVLPEGRPGPTSRRCQSPTT